MHRVQAEGTQIIMCFPLPEMADDGVECTREEFAEIVSFSLEKWQDNWKLVVDEVNLQSRLLSTLRSYQKELEGTESTEVLEEILRTRRPNYLDALREFVFKVDEVNQEFGKVYVF